MTEDNIDIFVISETKIDNSFPENQFSIYGYNLPTMMEEVFWYISEQESLAGN